MNTVTPIDGVAQREARLAHWQKKAEAFTERAHALESLADHVESLEAPVANYQPTWTAVVTRLREDAKAMRVKADDSVDRVVDIRGAMVARERFVANANHKEAQ